MIGALDLSIVVIYLLIMMVMGILLRKRASRGMDSYFLGNKEMPWWMLAFSGSISNFDITGTMWIVSLIYLIGVRSMWVHWMWGAYSMPVISMVFMGRWIRRANVMTQAEWIKKRFAIGLDVEGTSLKSAVVASNGSILENSFRRTPINSETSADSIIETFVQTLNSHLKTGLKIEGIGIGFPGPFDYKKGICLIPPHLHKFQALYGLNIKEELMERTGVNEILFENDAWTFLRGEEWVGAAKGFRRIIGVTIGTGMGSSFMIDGRIVFRGRGVPRSGWIGGMRCDWGIVEERVSQRWILRRYLELTGRVAESVEQIVKDAASLKVFEELGETIGDVLLPIAQRFGADCIVFGGQISKSFQLFEKPIRDRLDRVPSLKSLGSAKYIDLSPVYGAAKLVFGGFR